MRLNLADAVVDASQRAAGNHLPAFRRDHERRASFGDLVDVEAEVCRSWLGIQASQFFVERAISF